jgi:Fe-S cluster biogenesis protein NfuA
MTPDPADAAARAVAPALCDDAEIAARVGAVLELEIRPLLQIHGGGIDLLSVSNGALELEFQGACRGCALQGVTYAVAVRQRLLEVPGVTDVAVKGIRLSRFALERTAAMYKSYSFRPSA